MSKRVEGIVEAVLAGHGVVEEYGDVEPGYLSSRMKAQPTLILVLNLEKTLILVP